MTAEQNRTVGQRRVQGVCWCCASAAKVRPCTFWLLGVAYPLCKKCEKEQAVLKPDPKPKPPPPFPDQCIGRWESNGDLTPLAQLADWYDEKGRQPELARTCRDLAADPDRAESVRFFLIHAARSWDLSRETEDEGMLRGAAELERAEHWLKASKFLPVWEQDPDYNPDDSDYPGTTEAGEVIERGWGCMLQCQCTQCRIDRSLRFGRQREHVGTSLWGITLKDDVEPPADPYCRVVEAELAMELMAELEIER